MGAQVNSNAIANIYWLIETFTYQSFEFHVHFRSILVYNLKTKSYFWSKDELSILLSEEEFQLHKQIT